MTETLNPMEFMKKTAEASRLKENDRKTQEITKKMVDNSGIFAGQIEEEKSQLVCQDIFANLGTKYNPDEKGSIVGGIEATLKNLTASNLQKTIAKENLNILGEAAFRAINFSFRDYPKGLITSHLTAEEIDNFLTDEMRGLGKHIVETDSSLTDDDKKIILEINKNVSEVIKDKTKFKDSFEIIIGEIKDKLEDSFERQYGELALNYMSEKLDFGDKRRMDDEGGTSYGKRLYNNEKGFNIESSGELDSKAISAQELYRHPLTDFTPEGIKKWGADIVTRLGNDSLFWNQGWTQLASFIDAQTYEAKTKIRLSGGEKGEKERVENACMFVEAAVTVRAHEEALYASDAVLTLYVAALPPADRMTDKRYLWESRNANALCQVKIEENIKKEIEPSILNIVHEDLLSRAYSAGNGGEKVKELRKRLKDGRDKLAEDYYKKIKAKMEESSKDAPNSMEKFKKMNNKEILDQARLAVSMFIVEDYVPWANWIYTNVGKDIPVWECKDGKWKSNGTSKFDWIEKSDLMKKRRSKMSDERFVDYKEEEVEIWSTDIKTIKPKINEKTRQVIRDKNGDIEYDEASTGLENPLMTLIRPIDVLRTKRDFAEDINRPLHEAFYALSSEIWMVGSEGRDKFTHQVIVDKVKSFPKTSELKFKQVSRWAKAWEKMIGDSHGDKVESMEGVSEGAGKIVNMFTAYDNWGRENLAGAIVGNIWAAKIKAALSRGDENFVRNILRTGAALGEYNKEQSMLVSQIYGSDMSQDFGVIRDAVSRLNLNIDTPAFKLARKMIVTSSTDEEHLDTLYGLKKAFVLTDIVGSFVSGYKGKGGKKR